MAEEATGKSLFEKAGEARTRVASTTIGDMVGWTRIPAMAVGYLSAPVILAVGIAGYAGRDYIETAVEAYARSAIEDSNAKDRRFIPADSCLRYSVSDKVEYVTVSDACKPNLSLDLVVTDTGNTKNITLNTGLYKIEGVQATRPEILQKIPESYQQIQ